MAERSHELEQLLRDDVEAMMRGDSGALGLHTSHDECVLSIGTDASEWVEGYDEIMALFREAGPSSDRPFTLSIDEVKAYVEGSVAWAASRGHFEVDGKRVPVRMTGVMHREDGEWKSVQGHASIGVPNDRMLDPMFTDAG